MTATPPRPDGWITRPKRSDDPEPGSLGAAVRDAFRLAHPAPLPRAGWRHRLAAWWRRAREAR